MQEQGTPESASSGATENTPDTPDTPHRPWYGKVADERASALTPYLTQPLAGRRQRGESDRAVCACNDYLRMGPGRSVLRLVKAYKAIEKQGAGFAPLTVPSSSRKTLYNWSALYGWVDRARRYDSANEALRAEHAEEIMRSGYAQAHERVLLLDGLIRSVSGHLEDKTLYGRRAKVIGYGEAAREVVEQFFRKDEIDALRGLLDDIARETGGRQRSAAEAISGIASLLSTAGAFGPIQEAHYEDLSDDENEANTDGLLGADLRGGEDDPF